VTAHAGTPSIDDAEMVGEPTRQRRRGFSMNLRRVEFYIFLSFGVLILAAIGIVKVPNPFARSASASATPPPIAGSSTLGEAVLDRSDSDFVPLVGAHSRLPLRGDGGGANGTGTPGGAAAAAPSPTSAPDPLLAKVMEQEAAANRQPSTSGTVIMPPPPAQPATVALQTPPPIVPNPREAVAQAPQAPPPTFPPDTTTPAPQVYTAVVSGGIAHGAVAQPPADQSATTGAVASSRTPTEDINARRQAFASSNGATPGYLNSTERAARSEVEVFAGTPLRWQLDDTINTDLPGTAQAHLLYDVHSSLPPYPTVFPRGSTATIRYFPSVLNGESRVEVVSDVIKLPDGRSFDLQGMPNSDVDGSSGFAASSRDDHRGRLFTTTFLTAILAAGLQLSQPATGSILGAPSVGQQVAGAVGSSVAQTGQQLIQSQVNKPPTLIVERGRQYITRLRSTIVVDPYNP
jgi:type IV secretory pathway VirB10-like protein